jgi:nucleotide-binding universal stress UspA family protein
LAVAKANHVDSEAHHVGGTSAHATILETAKKKKCDLIVVASHGRSGVKAAVLGSVTRNILVNSSLPVLACR